MLEDKLNTQLWANPVSTGGEIDLAVSTGIFSSTLEKGLSRMQQVLLRNGSCHKNLGEYRPCRRHTAIIGGQEKKEDDPFQRKRLSRRLILLFATALYLSNMAMKQQLLLSGQG